MSNAFLKITLALIAFITHIHSAEEKIRDPKPPFTQHIEPVAPEDAPLTITDPDFFNPDIPEKMRIDAQIAFYDTLYDNNPLTNRHDFETKKIPGYIALARLGLAYVRHHYRTDDQRSHENLTEYSEENKTIVLNRCDTLEDELNQFIENETENAGMTAIEFLCFNVKLAAIQEIELNENIAKNLGIWNPGEKKPLHNHTIDTLCMIPFVNQEQWGEITPSIVKAKHCVTPPYFIYTPKGSFSPKRIVNQILSQYPSILIGMTIGRLPIDTAPHNASNRFPVSFLWHDLFHMSFFSSNLKHKIPHFQSQQRTIPLDLNDPIIILTLFYCFHEFEDYFSYNRFLSNSFKINQLKNDYYKWYINNSLPFTKTADISEINMLLQALTKDAKQSRNDFYPIIQLAFEADLGNFANPNSISIQSTFDSNNNYNLAFSYFLKCKLMERFLKKFDAAKEKAEAKAREEAVNTNSPSTLQPPSAAVTDPEA